MAQRAGPARIFARPPRRARMREGGCLSQATFSWVRPVLALGAARTLGAGDLFEPGSADAAASAASSNCPVMRGGKPAESPAAPPTYNEYGE